MLSLILNFSTTAFAASYSGKTVDIIDTSVEIITKDSLQDVFGFTDKTNGEVLIDKVTYSYEFIPTEDLSSAEVLLHFTIILGDREYNSTTTGTVDSYQLSSGEILWEGPLSGKIEINKTTFKVLAGFSKIDSCPDIQVSVTIQSESQDSAIEPVVFTFGEVVITMEIYQELANNTQEAFASFPESEEMNSVTASNASSFSYIGYDYEYFDSGFNISGYSQRSRGYFNSGTNQFAVTLKSYCSNIENYFSTAGIAGATIKSFDIELIRNNYTTSSYSWIAGTESYDFNSGNYGAGAVLLKPLFEDIMGILGVPTSTISSIFDGLKGSVEESFHTNDTTVSVSFGLLQDANFDNSSVGVPIVFQLSRNSNNYSGNSSYTFVTSITYRTVYIATGSSYPAYIYIDGYDTSKTVSVTLG